MQVKKLDDLSYLVKNGESEYLVWYNKGRFTCECKGYYFYAPTDPDFKCKHVNFIMNLLGLS